MPIMVWGAKRGASTALRDADDPVRGDRSAGERALPRIYREQAGELPHHRPRLRVVIADDQTILRLGLRAILEGEPDLEVIGEASNVQDAVALSRCLQPDVVVTDVSFADGSSIKAIGQLRRECVGVHVVMLTSQIAPEYVRAAMAAGAYAFVAKDSSIGVLLRAIRSEAVEHEHPKPKNFEQPAAAQIAQMTARERQVLVGVALGHSSKRIAGNLGRSVKTIEKHRFKMMHRLGLHNAAAVTRFAIDNRLLQTDDEAQESRPASSPPI
jgi:DNA-binding NarL/FixJ family response regulator